MVVSVSSAMLSAGSVFTVGKEDAPRPATKLTGDSRFALFNAIEKYGSFHALYFKALKVNFWPTIAKIIQRPLLPRSRQTIVILN